MSILAICPSRGRPKAARETLISFHVTQEDPDSRIVFVVDDDDPTADEYPQGHTLIVQAGGTMGAALRRATSPDVLADATSVGMIGDDNRFRSSGWDRILDGHLSAHVGIAYGDDGYQHERLPTSWWMSRPIVDALGMAHPALRHLFMDNWAKALGEGAGVLRYFPEVHIEHLHPLAGKADDDEVYRRGQRNGSEDGRIFRRWQRRGMDHDVAIVRRLARGTQPRNVLADWHHPALWESLSILFEDRFGWRLWSPYGMDWADHGWQLRNGTPGWGPERYLCAPSTSTVDGVLTTAGREYPDRPRRLVTWDQFRSMRFDYVLSSVSEHQRSFADIARQAGAVAIHQVGNAHHPIDRTLSQIILASAVVRVPSAIRYHQEFDRDLFNHVPSRHPSRVTSFMLRMETTSGPWQWLADAPGVTFRSVGGASPDDPAYLAPMAKVAAAMRDTGWVWHDKRIGDGYGHVLWTAAAMGRPLIGHASHYRGLLGQPLWRDLATCVDLDIHSPTEASRLVRAISADPEWHSDLSENMAVAFDRAVDFAAEADTIRSALDNR